MDLSHGLRGRPTRRILLSAHLRTGGKTHKREQRWKSSTFRLYGGEKIRNNWSLSLEDFSTPPTRTRIKAGDTDRPSPSNRLRTNAGKIE
jgi:hypothetical protein